MERYLQRHNTEGPGLEVTNPATGHLLTTVRAFHPEEIEPMIAAAQDALPGWSGRTAKDRARILRAWHDLILENRAALAAIVTAESGKPLGESDGEVAYAAAFVEWFAEEGKRAYGETIPTFAAGKRVLTLREPVGVCAAITPWNFPLAMITRKAAPALAAGCTMLVKPAEATPLSALALADLAYQAGVPAAVLQIVPATDPAGVGRVFCQSPGIRKISFTGSTAVGKLLMAQSASTVKRVSMELGGNAPFIVFDDADIEQAVAGLLASKFRNAGQTCVCANRVLVQSRVHDSFLARLRERVASLQVGNGAEPGVAIGPLINGMAVAKVEKLVVGATASGAKVELGGGRHPAGPNFYAPTILTGVTADMEIAVSEIFGPVVPVIRFEAEEEAIRIANATPYGLAAYFYARDIGRVWRVLGGLEFGMVAINEGALSTEVAPFGGVKESGVGREGARQGLDEYLEIKYVLMGGLSA